MDHPLMALIANPRAESGRERAGTVRCYSQKKDASAWTDNECRRCGEYPSPFRVRIIKCDLAEFQQVACNSRLFHGALYIIRQLFRVFRQLIEAFEHGTFEGRRRARTDNSRCPPN